MSKFAWVTLTTNDTYSLGALVLAHSLRRAGTAHQLAILVTPGVSESMVSRLKDVYNVVQEVNVMDSQDAANLALLARPELGITFTKLHCWRLVQFEKCVFLDSDTLVLQNCDELFEREELSAAPDVSWPDCFNSGVFVFKPSLDTFAKITELAVTSGSFDGGDQGLLNSYFADWATADIKKHLPFIYNVTAYASYCYLPAFKQFRDKIKILHFAGKMKPWLIQFNSESKTACTPSEYAHAHDLIQLWWNIFCDNVHQNLTDNMHYWPTSMQWNYYEQIYSNNNNNNEEQYEHHQQHHHHQNHHHHHHHNHQHHHQIDHYHNNEAAAKEFYAFDLSSIKDYHDPWEDYYENLEHESGTVETQQTYEAHTQQEVVPCREEQTAVEDAAHEYEQHTTDSPIEQNSSNNNNANETILYEEAKSEHTATQSHTEQIAQHHSNAEAEHDNHDHDNHAHDNHAHANDNDNDNDNVVKETSTKICSSNYEDIHKTENVHSETTTNENDVNLLNVNVQTNYHSLDSSRKHTDKPKVNEAGLAGALSQLRLGEQRTPEQEAYEQLMRRQCWESGQIDYSGKDSFENIWKKISQTLEQKPSTKDDKSGSS